MPIGMVTPKTLLCNFHDGGCSAADSEQQTTIPREVLIARLHRHVGSDGRATA